MRFQELFCPAYTEKYSLYHNHIGPGQSPQFAVSDFCRQAAQIETGLQEAVIRTGNLDAERDFTDVRDVVRAYALLAEKGGGRADLQRRQRPCGQDWRYPADGYKPVRGEDPRKERPGESKAPGYPVYPG